MSISLYRKYRPQNFASVVGQKPAVEVLTTSITKRRIGHAYLFSGSRGCGKTSVARIFAKAMNCLNPHGFEPCGECKNCTAITAGESLDVIEIDGASNNGVDEVRQLKENITLAPFSSKYKIYIIDEVHMLSGAAFNALLKTLEEPPEYVVFIMATTEPHKVPVTIRSRCQHIPFHSITTEDIFARLKFVCESEGATAEDEALYEIARQADGALRDALSLLEQVIASGNITLASVEAVFGAGSRPAFERWITTLRTDHAQAYTSLKSMFDAGASGTRVFEEMFSLVRNLWLASNWNNITDSLGISQNEKAFIAQEIPNWTASKLHSLLNKILRALNQARLGIRPDILLGMFMLSLEAAPAETEEKVEPPPVPSFMQIPAPEPAPQVLPFSPDPNLKAELMEIAAEEDFTLYCAMFDVNAGLRGSELVLETLHEFTYETLKIDKRSAKVQSAFAKYGQVVLKFGQSEVQCLEPVEEVAPLQAVTAPEPQISEPEVVEPDFFSSPVHDDTPPAVVHKGSAFNKFRQAFASLGVRSEIILRRYNEADENADTSTTLEGDDD